MLMNSTRLFAGMQERRLDALVATMPENVTYASGFWAMSQWIRRGPQAYVLTPAPALGEPVVVASSGLIDLAADPDVVGEGHSAVRKIRHRTDAGRAARRPRQSHRRTDGAGRRGRGGRRAGQGDQDARSAAGADRCR